LNRKGAQDARGRRGDPGTWLPKEKNEREVYVLAGREGRRKTGKGAARGRARDFSLNFLCRWGKKGGGKRGVGCDHAGGKVPLQKGRERKCKLTKGKGRQKKKE